MKAIYTYFPYNKDMLTMSSISSLFGLGSKSTQCSYIFYWL